MLAGVLTSTDDEILPGLNSTINGTGFDALDEPGSGEASSRRLLEGRSLFEVNGNPFYHAWRVPFLLQSAVLACFAIGALFVPRELYDVSDAPTGDQATAGGAAEAKGAEERAEEREEGPPAEQGVPAGQLHPLTHPHTLYIALR